MSNTRALVSCTILSLQDSCFVYPCCKDCLSRLILESKRATCGRCGFTCALQNLEYRYRLSFNVSRNHNIFGVTVFGGCLNPFFGISAGDLQRCIALEKTNGVPTVQQLLAKAVEDCFIGRHVIFGLKVPPNNAKTPSLSGQLVASQIIIPCESLMGRTVITYFKNLLRANSHHSESANNICPSQQKDSQSSQRDDFSSFDYTPPSCARLDSQPSSEGFTLSNAWHSPGLCFPPEELSNDLMQQTQPTCQLHHELQNETQSDQRKSLSSSCDMFESSTHLNSFTTHGTQNPFTILSCKTQSEITTSGQCLARAVSVKDYDAPFSENSLYGHATQKMTFDLEDAPLSENLMDFIRVEPPLSERNVYSSGKSDLKIHKHKRCSLYENSSRMTLCGEKLSSSMQCVSNKSWKETSENDSPENVEIVMKKAKMVSDSHTTSASRLKKMTTCTFNHIKPVTKSRFSLSNNKEHALKREKMTRNQPSVAFCSVSHEKGKHFRDCVQSEVHSVNCKVKQELTVFDDHADTYNCSVDLFASGQSSMDMNLSDVTEISKVTELSNASGLEPGASGSLLFSPCLQSTPVSYNRRSCVQKTGPGRKCVFSLCSKGSECTKSMLIDHKSDAKQQLDQLLTGFSQNNVQDASCNLTANVNEWSRDLFENLY